jgi:hypothetical protein
MGENLVCQVYRDEAAEGAEKIKVGQNAKGRESSRTSGEANRVTYKSRHPATAGTSAKHLGDAQILL